MGSSGSLHLPSINLIPASSHVDDLNNFVSMVKTGSHYLP